MSLWMWAEAYEHDERVQARKSDAHAITRGMSMRMRRTGQGSDGFSPCVRVLTLRVFFLGVPDGRGRILAKLFSESGESSRQ